MNGAGVIHDYELARNGANDRVRLSVTSAAVNSVCGRDRRVKRLDRQRRRVTAMDLARNCGRRIQVSDFPYRDLSLLRRRTGCRFQ